MMTGLAHKWFSSYLDNRKQYCKVNGTASSIKNIYFGVSQGSCQGPLLVLLYFNNLPFALKKAKVTMYADDTAISYSTERREELDPVFFSSTQGRSADVILTWDFYCVFNAVYSSFIILLTMVATIAESLIYKAINEVRLKQRQRPDKESVSHHILRSVA